MERIEFKILMHYIFTFIAGMTTSLGIVFYIFGRMEFGILCIITSWMAFNSVPKFDKEEFKKYIQKKGE